MNCSFGTIRGQIKYRRRLGHSFFSDKFPALLVNEELTLFKGGHFCSSRYLHSFYQCNGCCTVDQFQGTVGSLKENICEFGKSKTQEFCVHSHIIIGICWASLFWLQAVQSQSQFFHNGSAKQTRGRPVLDVAATRCVSS